MTGDVGPESGAPSWRYLDFGGPIAPFELHTWGEGLDMPVTIRFDERPSQEALEDVKREVYAIGDSFGLSVGDAEISWWIDLGTNVSEWEAQGLPTLLRAISGWAQAWGLPATIVLGKPELREWTPDERSTLDRALGELP